MADLYCLKCGEKLAYTGGGRVVCRVCGEENIHPEADREKIELYSKAQWYHRDGQYFNAIQMYDILLKMDEGDAVSYFGAIMAEFGATYNDMHDGTYTFVCERTHEHTVYESPYYQGLAKAASKEDMERYAPYIESICEEQTKNRERYLSSAPVDEKKDYRAEAMKSEEGYAEDYLSARERYLEREREEQEEALRRRREAQERETAAQKARENRAALARKKEKRKKLIITLSCAVLATALALTLVFTLVIPAIIYSGAAADIEAGDYDSAAKALRKIEGFSDSDAILSKYRFYGLEAGESVEFGLYEQNANGADGKESIEWIVLYSDDDSVTLISKYVLDAVMYHENKTAPAYWESSSLRAWLSGEFTESAFSDTEYGMLVEVENTNPDNVLCGTKGGAETLDRVYLLSIDEAEEYMKAENLVGIPTAYAKERGAYLKGEAVGTYWWLRSPGSTQNSAAKVNLEGEIDIRGSGVNYTGYGVRPVITVKKAVIE